MSLYAPLISIEVAHDYFASPERLVLTFVPDGRTRAWLEASECVVRAVENRLQIIYDTEAQAGGKPLAATGEAVELRFGVTAEDPLFPDYTDGLAAPMRPPVVMGLEPKAKADEVGVLPLTAQPDAMPWAGPRSHFVLAVTLTGDLSDAGRRYGARLTARAAPWKYILLDDWGDTTPCVVDARDDVAFGDASLEALADGRRRLAIRSQRALPIQERCDRQFQLRAVAADGAPGTLLIGRLPGAAPGRLALDPAGSGLVTEIYVAR